MGSLPQQETSILFADLSMKQDEIGREVLHSVDEQKTWSHRQLLSQEKPLLP
jgi:hypothetical protein